MGVQASMPDYESERVAELHDYRLIGTSQDDQRFDLFTKMACWIFGTPMSAINLVGSETTFFKSLVGLPVHVPDRRLAPCGHAVSRGKQVMVISNLAEDERFHDHPLVLEAGIHFYAGALLRSQRTGHALGVLCIGDKKPRTFSSDERSKLVDLARGVVSVLELHRTGLELQAAATTDPLTGLRNRRGFMEMLEDRTRSHEPFALFSLDLDGFKPVNDRFGHCAGDTVLCQVAERLRSITDRSDLIARTGGDEIIIVRSENREEDGVERFAELLKTQLTLPIQIERGTVRISTSIGIAKWPSDATTVEHLLQKADIALYEAKRLGPGQHRYVEQIG